VLAIEASRLARNGRDWHTLLEFCALMNSLIIDEDGAERSGADHHPGQLSDQASDDGR
jgi:hypothetical protein